MEEGWQSVTLHTADVIFFKWCNMISHYYQNVSEFETSIWNCQRFSKKNVERGSNFILQKCADTLHVFQMHASSYIPLRLDRGLKHNLVLSTGSIMWIGQRKEIQKLTFRALALCQCRIDEVLTLETSASKFLYSGQFTLVYTKTVDSVKRVHWLARETLNILCYLHVPPSNSGKNGIPVCIRDKWRNHPN